MLISIIGTGAIGGYYGARLAQHGHDVHFLLRSDYSAVQKNGWTIRSHQGDFSLSPHQFHAYDDPRQMPKADVVIVTLKTTANDQFTPLITPLLKDNTAILTLQNGLGNEEQLASLFGPQRILGGNAFTCVNRIAPGVLHHQAEGAIRLGEFQGGRSDRALRLVELFRSSQIDCDVLDDLRTGRWHKLSWNVPFNGLGALMDCTTDRLIASAEGLPLVTSLMNEIIAAAGAIGVVFPPAWLPRMIDKTRAMGVYMTSMQIDRRAGRILEVEAILGEPLRQGTTAGVAMPQLQTLYAMAKVINDGRV